MSITEKVIYDGVIYITEKPATDTRIIYVNNTIYKSISFTLDLSNSSGASVEGLSTLVVLTEILPFSKVKIATIKLAKTYKLSISYKFTVKTPSDEVAKLVLVPYNESLQTLVNDSQAKFRNIDPLSLSPSSFALGENFIDPYFPPVDSSINLGSSSPIDYPIHWRRPKDFFQGVFKVYESISPNDILQGRLGNCWFMSALACIAENPETVQRLFIDSEVNESGFYRVRVNKGGEWIVVVVDDYFPCYPYAGPIFSKSVSNELWVLLLEKAYAKVHGSYTLLRSGSAAKSFMDLTGYPTLAYSKEDSQIQTMISDDTLWSTTLMYFNLGSLVAINTPGVDNSTEASNRTGTGLVSGHSYSVISMVEVLGNRILNIRNPWGSFEWAGDWSTSSPLWTDEIKAIVNPVLDANDGSFWMSYADALQYFEEFDVCCCTYKQEGRFKGVFRSEEVDGVKWIFADKYFVLEVIKNSKVVISIHQDDERVFGAKDRRKYLNVGFFVFESNMQYSNFVPIAVTNNDRDTAVQLNLEAGKKYIILPRVAGVGFIKDPNVIFEPFEWMSSGQMHPLFDSAIRDLFRKWNLVITDLLVYSEFYKMMKAVSIDYSETEFQQILIDFPSYQQGLTPNGLVEFIKYKYFEQGAAVIKQWFELWGYDDDLFSFQSRFFLVTVHSTELIIFNESSENFEETFFNGHQFVLRKTGTSKLKVGGANAISLYEKSDQTFLYGFVNENNYPIQVVFDLSESTGIDFNGKSTFEFRLEALELKLLTYFEVAAGVGTYNIKSSTTVNQIS